MTPTGGELSVTTKAVAPAASMEIASSVPETLTLSPSPRHPRSTPARGQTWTPGFPSRRDGGSTVGQDKNSTGRDVEMPSMAPSLGMNHGSKKWVTSSFPESPGPTHGSPQGTTDVPLHTTGKTREFFTTDPPFTAPPTDYVVWHPSPALGIPLNSTRLQNEDSGPSSFPGPPSDPNPEAPEPPACGESSGVREPSGNLSLSEP